MLGSISASTTVVGRSHMNATLVSESETKRARQRSAIVTSACAPRVPPHPACSERRHLDEEFDGRAPVLQLLNALWQLEALFQQLATPHQSRR